MRFSLDRQQWEHTREVEKLHGLSETRDADMPPSLRRLLGKFRDDVSRLEAERDRLRAALEELRAAVRMHDCRGSHKMRLIIDRALNPEPTT